MQILTRIGFYLIIGAGIALLNGCAHRCAKTDLQDNWQPKSITAKPASKEKIPIGVLLGYSNETVTAYPRLREVGPGLEALVREHLHNSEWFTICAIDPKMITMFEQLKDHYYHGNLPADKLAAGKTPEFILQIHVTRINPNGCEDVIGGVKTFTGNCEVKITYEITPLISASANMADIFSSEGIYPVRETQSIFGDTDTLRSSAFGMATERSIHNGISRLVRSSAFK